MYWLISAAFSGLLQLDLDVADLNARGDNVVGVGAPAKYRSLLLLLAVTVAWRTLVG
jgi:hypothetical protein